MDALEGLANNFSPTERAQAKELEEKRYLNKAEVSIQFFLNFGRKSNCL